MSVYFSRFGLNSYYQTAYHSAHIPADYPLSLVLQKCRAFRRLPPRLRELAGLAKRWVRRAYPDSDFSEWDRWYSKDGRELDPNTGRALTDAEIDAEWARWPVPDLVVRDIPLPAGGFADPDTWEEPPPPPEEPDPDEGISHAQLMSDIASHGREYVAKDYGVPEDVLRRVKSDEDLARIILGARGKP